MKRKNKFIFIVILALLLSSLTGCSAVSKVGNLVSGAFGSTTEQEKLSEMQSAYDKKPGILKVGSNIAYGATSLLSGIPLIGGFAKKARDGTVIGKINNQKTKAENEKKGNQMDQAFGGSFKWVIIILIVVLIALFVFLKIMKQRQRKEMRAEMVEMAQSGLSTKEIKAITKLEARHGGMKL